MGRQFKIINTEEGFDRRESGYYSTPEFVANFITKAMLQINPVGKYVLDPAVGKEELLKGFANANKEIDSFDIYDYGKHDYAKFEKQDFIKFYENIKSNAILNQSMCLKYDYYIANPPYNCHEIEYISKNKTHLKSLFKEIGVHNMYSMFLSALIDCAKDGALMGIITLDSFLTARMHQELRNKIIRECDIHYLILCPSDLFWSQKSDVRTCILILQKGKKSNSPSIKVAERPQNSNELKVILERDLFKEKKISEMLLSGDKDNGEFLVDCPPLIKNFFVCKRIGELYNCITGISTGDDKKYISEKENTYHNIPFYKNPGMRRFYTEPDGFLPNDFLDIDKHIPNFMVRNKQYLFHEGIVCSSMGVAFGACYLPPNCTFGVNAKIVCEKEDVWWLLGYLNSSLVTYFVRTCLIRSNMITSGYVARIPMPYFSPKVRKHIGDISLEAYETKVGKNEVKNFIDRIDEAIFDSLDLPKNEIDKIKNFVADVWRLV